MIRTFLVFFVLISNVILAQNKLNLIPYPQKVESLQGEFIIPEKENILDQLKTLSETPFDFFNTYSKEVVQKKLFQFLHSLM